MSKKIIRSYIQWANENNNLREARDIGLDPWEVFKLSLLKGEFIYKEETITQENTDEERRNEELSTGNTKDSSGVSKSKSSRKGR